MLRRKRVRFDACAGVVATALALTALPAWAQDAAPVAVSPPAETKLEAGKLPVPAAPPEANLPAVDPVISDEAFNKAIPSLDVADDAELDRPLESIEEFERQMASKQAGAKPTEGQRAPAGNAALADGTATEQIGDAPVNDPELNKPLPPIDQFQVEPVQFAEADEDDKAAEVAYRVEVNGLDKADAETETDLRDLFDDLSALGSGKGKAANAAMVTARLTEDEVLLERILASEGWFGARVRTRLSRGGEASQDREDEDGGEPATQSASARPAAPGLTAVLDVTPGKRYTLGSIVILAAPTIPADLVSRNLALKTGEPIVAQRVQGAEAQIAVALPQEGYPFAEVGQRDVLLDRDTGQGDYTLPVTVGPRARFGDIATTGDLAFDAKHVGVLTRFKRGELYDSRKVDDLRQAMVATGLFSSVAIEPQRSGQKVADDPDGAEYVTMMVTQDAGPPRTIAGTLGYGTGQGLRAEATWTHRNMFRPEGALIAHGVAGTQEQGAGVTFRRSNAGQRDRTFELTAEALHTDYEAYNAYTGRLAARIARDSTPIWQKKLTYAAGVELLASGEEDYDFALGKRQRRTFYIAALSGQLGFDTSDDLLNPTKGYRLTTLIQPEGSLEGGFTPYVRARIDGSAYYSVSKDVVLAGRVRFGTIQGAARNDIAPSRRFYAGGGGSVRGFGYQELGPQDPDGKPIGGRSVNEAAAEVRYRFGNFGIVGFVDVGQAYESTMPKFSDLRYGAGIGGRFYTNFGPMRLDIATPINRRPGEARVSVYVSIGQAF
ncbi:BamA/TamA family outer membrane protein [Novosphingobium sp. JCM 18896]|uniref:BamA/TamA family outer membrane protein n=1 Tax=Novosphingobium sp. JCM 18896 TaxID=2989731 RepID=UPI0022233B0D|nr:BamA/TamA family outer membrane protein [Novosphingobium sp. JCM 18896]MCW1427574.1 BamA/TamA family outer membrane protein [Novosphingobium sp. JCM 18896]